MKRKLESNKEVENLVINNSIMDILPDDIVYKIMIEVNYLTLIEICSLSKRYKNICYDSKLWQYRVELEFGSEY